MDLEPLSSRVAHVASLSMAEKQLICSFPSLLDITITVLCQQSTLKSIFAWSREIFVCAEINGSVSNRVCWWSEPSSGLAQPRRTARAEGCLPARTGPALRLLSLTTLDISTIKWSQQEKMTEVSQLKVFLTESDGRSQPWTCVLVYCHWPRAAVTPDTLEPGAASSWALGDVSGPGPSWHLPGMLGY